MWGSVNVFGKVEKYGMCVSAYCERESLRVVYVLCVNMRMCGDVYMGYLGMRA